MSYGIQTQTQVPFHARAEKEINLFRWLSERLTALHTKYLASEPKRKDPSWDQHPRDKFITSVNMSAVPLNDLGKFLEDFHEMLRKEQISNAFEGMTMRAIRQNDSDLARSLKKHVTLNFSLTTFMREELKSYYASKFPGAERQFLFTMPEVLDNIEADLGARAYEESLEGDDFNVPPRRVISQPVITKDKLMSLVDKLGISLDPEKAEALGSALCSLGARG
jgi:hypothetical protein